MSEPPAIDPYAIPYPPIERLGVVGDRRTAALVAADGTVCWLCLPNYDGAPVFGALLDAGKGGSWRIGPRGRRFGSQRYVEGAPCLQTMWDDADGTLELLDAMAFPDDRRRSGDDDRRILVRRLRCTRGVARAHLALSATDDFREIRQPHVRRDGVVTFDGNERLSLWCSAPLTCRRTGAEASLDLRAGDEVWCVFGPREDEHDWSTDRAAAALAAIQAYWGKWLGRIQCSGPRAGAIQRAAMLVHLLTFAPSGAVVAAVSASLPERLAGRRNYDYRFAWIRDSSLGLALLSRLGSTDDAERFMDWLAHLRSESDMPLQVLYRINGDCDAAPVERGDIDGYRMSRPVRFGNRAAPMQQIGSFGFLVDCALTYLEHGGTWKDEYWSLIARVADYTAVKFDRPGASIWEIAHEHQYVASKVMSWLTLDRAVKIARRTGRDGPFLHDWERVAAIIKSEVLEHGWSPETDSFRQRYRSDAVDAALLLIPLSELLPVDDPRVTSTIERLVDVLDVNGFLQRFVPRDVAGDEAPPLVEAEGAFLMCTFWLAQVLARRGECARAEAILKKADAIAGELGIFSEAVDARANSFLGNTPLLFSQVEYANAAMALAEAQGRPEPRAGARRSE